MTTGEESKKRRPRGEGGVRWDERRQRFVAETTVGYDARGKRIVRVGSGKSQSEALRRMRKAVSAYEAGLVPAGRNHTVAQAVEDWLQHRKRLGIDKETWDKDESLSRTHIVEVIGGQKLQRLTVQQVDNWLADRAGALAMSSLREVRRCLRQSIRRAQINGLVQSNVVDLSEMPKKAKDGRPSKSLTYEQACGVLTKTTEHRMYSYIVVSLLTGIRTEEVRALRWEHVHLDEEEVPYIEVWRSVRTGGDTKTAKSRRTLAVPRQVVSVLRKHKARQGEWRLRAGSRWTDTGLVFTSNVGTPLDASHVRRDFRLALNSVEGLDPKEWTPRELRHSFVSLLSEANVPVEEIARLVGHAGGSKVTELVYRHELRPVMETGARVMDDLFGEVRDVR
jgi:integrase